MEVTEKGVLKWRYFANMFIFNSSGKYEKEGLSLFDSQKT